MSRERCVFCMEEIKEEGAICPVCHRGIWEYDWKEEWLEPYTILKEKYLVVKRQLEENGRKRGKTPVWEI